MDAMRVVVLVAVLITCLRVGFMNAQKDDVNTFGLLRVKSYYFGSTFKLSWYKAADFCRVRGMFLVSTHTDRELDETIDYVAKSGYFKSHNELQMWTSGNDLGEEGQFHWGSTGERMVLDRFADNEPNNQKHKDGSTEDCIVLERSPGRNYTFDDRRCRMEYFFLCESLDC